MVKRVVFSIFHFVQDGLIPSCFSFDAKFTFSNYNWSSGFLWNSSRVFSFVEVEFLEDTWCSWYLFLPKSQDAKLC